MPFDGRDVSVDYFTVIAAPRPFSQFVISANFPVGTTLQEVIETLQPNEFFQQRASVFIQDYFIPNELHSRVRPNAGTKVYIKVVPSGGIIVAIIGSVVASAASSFFATVVSSALLANILGSIVGGIVALGLSTLFAPSRDNQITDFSSRGRTERESPTFSITGARNRANRFGPVPVVLGTHKMVPPYGANTYTEVVGDDQFLRFVVIWGYGPVNVTDIRIGNTPIENFEDVEQEHDFDGTLNSLELYPSVASQEDLQIELSTTFQSRFTANEVDEFGITITFPRGLFVANSGGGFSNRSVTLTAEYRVVGDSAFTPWFEEVITDNTREVKRFSRRETGLTRAEYEIRIKRSELSTSTTVTETAVWTAIRSFLNEDPIQMEGVAKSAFRIRASDQLSGVVDELNGIVSSKVEVLESAGWGGEVVSNNPAALIRYVLTGAPNDKALADSRLNDTSFEEFYNWCETEGFSYNRVIDVRVNVRELIEEIAKAGRGAITIIDDKWGVVIDKERDTVIQHFTPRNSFNFSSVLALREIPHALRVRFFNENKGYREDERIVFDDGFNSGNAENFVLLELPGQTDPDNIYKLTRYYLAQIRLRPEIFTISVDMEHLVASKGDLVLLNHVTPKVGLVSGRVKSVSGANLTVDEKIVIGSASYGMKIRLASGVTKTVTVNTGAGTHTTIEVSDTTGIQPGNLFSFGEVGEEALECIIQSITPEEDLQATIELLPYSPAVFNAADEIPAFTSLLSEPIGQSFVGPPTPRITDIISDESVLIRTTEGGLQPTILVYFQSGATSVSGEVTRTDSFRVRYRRSNTTDPWKYLSVLDADARSATITNVQQGQGYDVAVQAIGPFGEVSGFAQESNHVVIGTSSKPTPLTTFRLNTIGDHTYVEWTYDNIPIDITHFEIRYHPNQNVTAWGSMTVIAQNIPRSARSFTIPSRSGSYAIKAVDVEGQKSTSAKFINATLEDPESLNVVDTIEESPYFLGTKTNTVVDGSQLKLELDSAGVVVEQEGFYEFDANPIDLSEVYTSRLFADLALTSENTLNVMSTWENLSSLDSLSGDQSGDDYGAEIQVAFSLDDNSAPVFTDWQPFVVGDYTARFFKFRLKLTTTLERVTPVITELIVTIDMPDRVVSGNDIASGAGTKSVDFSPHFKVLKAVQITGQDMNSGDYFILTNKTRTGFDITFKNSSNADVDRTFDYQAIGYGRERGT